MGRLFLQRLIAHAGGALDERPRRIIVGRPVEYAGARPDPELARQRYDAMLAAFGTEIYYVHEPLCAAHSYASRLIEPATILVRSEEHTSELQSLMRISYAVFCMKNKTPITKRTYRR